MTGGKYDKLVFGLSFRHDLDISASININGISQNALFFYELLECLGHEPYLLFGDEHAPNTISTSRKSYRVTSMQKAVDGKVRFDIAFEIGTTINRDVRDILRDSFGTKTVCVRYGHSLYMDMEQMCYGATMAPGIHVNKPEMLWASPHFEKAFAYYETLYDAPVRMSPYIWEPDFIDNRFTKADYKRKPSIYVMEPNISILKNALIPMAIIEQVYRHEPDVFHEANIQCGMQFFENAYFRENIVANMPCFVGETKKGFFNPRRSFEEVFKARDVLLGYQHECELNYLYLEALYKGVPLVHNSPAFQEVGYFYHENDVHAGREKVLEAIADRDVAAQQAKNDAFMDQYSIHNEQVQKGYAALIEEVLDL